VNAGLMTLMESAGVMMGANVGTTLTAWLVSFFGFKVKIAHFALPIIAFGFPLLFMRNGKAKHWGEFLIGFALLFMGLAALKGAVPDLKGNPQVLEFLATYSNMGILSTLLFIGVGTLLTIVVQSSSAAMALTITMCHQGWIPFEIAAPMVLGENIGTTITAELASLVANVHAKRSARIHSMFNIIGVTWMIFAYPYYLEAIGWLMESYGQVSPLTPTGDMTPEQAEAVAHSIPIGLSYFHTAFNVSNVLIMIWFVPLLVNLAIKMVPSKGDDEDFSLEFIGRGLVQTPEISLAEAQNEIEKFAKLNVKGVNKISQLIEETESKNQRKLIDKIKDYENHTDLIEVKVGEFLMELSRSTLSSQSSRQVQSWLSVINHMESIGDIYYQMSRSVERKIEKKLYFEERHRESLREMKGLVDQSMVLMIENLHLFPHEISMDKAIEIELAINKKRDKYRARGFKNIEKGKVTLDTGLIYMDLIDGYKKIADNVIHISQALRGDHLDLEDEITT
ncbi:Na/Pi cotransporter family protein, partial [Bacteroidota bacterium]